MRAGVPATLILLALAACSGNEPLPSAPAMPELVTLEVQRQQVTRERQRDGVVEAVHRATLSAQTRGRVVELPFDVNDHVQAGQVLVRFTDVEQRSVARQAQAALRAAQATFAEADAEHRRIDEIHARGLVSRSQLDQALVRRDSAAAQLQAARAALQEAGEHVDYTQVRAPYTGLLTGRHVEAGETVQPGQPLLSVLSLDRLRIQVAVTQTEAAAIRADGRAWLLLDDGRRIQAARVTVFPQADPARHDVQVRVELPETATGLMPGMIAKVAFADGEVLPLLLPETSLLRRGELLGVYVQDSQGRVLLRQLRIGRRHDGQVEVLAGVREGERVVADPLQAQAWLASARHAP